MSYFRVCYFLVSKRSATYLGAAAGVFGTVGFTGVRGAAILVDELLDEDAADEEAAEDDELNACSNANSADV